MQARSNALSGIALLLSITSLGFSLWSSHRVAAEVQDKVRDELQKKELAIIEVSLPTINQALRECGLKEAHPRSIEELVAAFIKPINALFTPKPTTQPG